MYIIKQLYHSIRELSMDFTVLSTATLSFEEFYFVLTFYLASAEARFLEL